MAQKRARWVQYLGAAAPPSDGEPGALLRRPTGFTPGWRARVETLAPFFDRLNSSNADVEHEMEGMRERALQRDDQCKFLKLGGDGLLFIRVSRIIADDPAKYIFSAPSIIPGLGEQPHGLFHLTHAVWRVRARTHTSPRTLARAVEAARTRFRRSLPLPPSPVLPPSPLACAILQIFNDFIMACMEVIGNSQVQVDPTVEEHNAVQHAIQIVIRACAEYVRELCDEVGATPFTAKERCIKALERNIDAAELVHFLDDGGFLVLQHKNAVRSDDEHILDLSWREFITLGRSVAGHKTQYAPH